MDGAGENIGVYAEAKGEYTRQLTQFLVPALLSYFLQTLDEVKQKEQDPKKLLWNFQNFLKDVPDWNMDKVKRETTRVSDLTKCDYLQELLTAVFIAHTKVLAAIRLSSKQKKLQIAVPKLDHFLHRTLSDCARVLWSNVYYFSPGGSSVERQKSLNSVEQLLNDGILQSIRSMLPVKSILREYLNDDGDDEEGDKKEEEVSEPEPKQEEPPPPPSTPVAEAEPAPAPAPASEPAPAPAPAPEPEPEPAPEPVPAPVIPVPEEAPAVDIPPPTPVLVIETEPMVRFTGIDTVFHPDDPSKHTLKEMTEKTIEDEDEEELDENFFVEPETTALSLNDFEEV
jgi:hypothetical protein